MASKKRKVNTADTLRDTAGVGTFINAESGDHKGFTKRRVETKRIDEITAADIKKPNPEQEPWTHPFFGKREGE